MLVLCAVVGGGAPAPGGTLPVCGNGIREANEACDGGDCCTSACTIAPNGTPCGTAGPCKLSGACIDFTCFDGAYLPDGAACSDGDPCTVGETCDVSFPSGVVPLAQCVGGTRRCTVTPTVNKAVRLVPGAPAIIVDCNVPGGAGGACSAAAFLPQPPATAGGLATPNGTAGAAHTATVEAGAPDLACDFTRQVSRSVSRPLDDTGTARLKLKLNKLVRRLLRKLPVSDMVSLTVCTKVDFPNGESITLVDVVNAARK
jgi:hypothetical protein